MSGNFIPHPILHGDGRCRVCNLPYRKDIDAEVRQHRRFHKDYLRACDSVGAPMPEHVREQRRRDGLAVQFSEGTPFAARLAAAEAWLEAEHHGHLFEALRYGVNRLDLREFFTANVEGPGRLALFQPDVARELRLRYSDNFIGPD